MSGCKRGILIEHYTRLIVVELTLKEAKFHLPITINYSGLSEYLQDLEAQLNS
jgi:hypothetical protein